MPPGTPLVVFGTQPNREPIIGPLTKPLTLARMVESGGGWIADSHRETDDTASLSHVPLPLPEFHTASDASTSPRENPW